MLRGIYEKQKLQSWTDERWIELRAVYHAMVSRLDHQFGMLVSLLKEKGFYDDTDILMYSDHGDYTGDYGIVEKSQNTLEDPISNVPFIIKPHKGIDVKPRVSNALVELADIPATVAELAGIDLGYTQFGKSLVHTLSGGEFHKDAVFCEGGRICGETQAMERGHGPQSEYWPRLSTQCGEDGAHGKAVMCRMGKYKYTHRLYETSELYDLEADPMELENIAGAPEMRELVNDMKLRILRFYMETADYVPNRKDKR